MKKSFLTDDERLVIKNCLLAVEKVIHRSSASNEYYICPEDFNYELLSEPIVNVLKRLAENY